MASTRYILRGGQWRGRTRAPVPAVPSSEIPTTPTPWLPYDMATREAILASPKKLWGHAFVDYAIGGDGRSNSTTWYTNRMPGGTLFQDYGGYYRDRPLQPPGVTRPRTETSWWILDRAYEVYEARLAGFHGFMIDWLNRNDGTGDNRTGQLREYCEAVRYLGLQDDFKIIIMPDCNTSIGDGSAYSLTKAKLQELIDDYPDVLYKDTDGRFVVFPYSPESVPSSVNASGQRVVNKTDAPANRAYWETFIADMEDDGYHIKWGMCYQNNWVTFPTATAASADLDGVWMLSRWGDRDYASSGGSSNQNRGAPAYSRSQFGKPWMHPVSCQDSRYNNVHQYIWEAGNTKNLINSWMAAIDGNAEWVQIPTWSDLREHAHMIPTYNHGHCWLDISGFFEYRWLFDEWPEVQRDCIFLSHRIHRTDDYTVTGEQSIFSIKNPNAPTALENKIEALCFLTTTANTQVEITVNGVATPFIPDTSTRAVTGVDGLHSFRLEMPSTGTVSATIKRGGVTVATITSPHTITNTPVAQDMHYRVVGSIRGVES